MRKITIDQRYQGPFGAANGGYVAGLLGDALRGAPNTVRFEKPVPVDTPIYIYRRGNSAFIRHAEETVATAELTNEAIPSTPFVAPDRVLSGSEPALDMAMFADCFVCGRGAPDGLGIEVRALPDGRFAALWRPADSSDVEGPLVEAIHLRSALDCPGGFAALTANQTLALTGTLTSRIAFLPEASERLVVVGESTWSEGRKLGAVTTIFTDTGDLVATASAVWVAIPSLAGAMN